MKLRLWLIIFSAWTLLAFPYASHLYLYLTMRGFQTTWGFQFLEALAGTYTWAVLTPFLLRIANQYPVLSTKPWKLMIHLPAALGISFLQVTLHVLVDVFLVHWNEPLQLLDTFSTIFSRTYFFGLIIYALVLCMHAAFELYKRKELENARIRAEVAENELKLLKAQVQPHFLFNTLNTIVSLIYQDAEKAHAMVSKLSHLLRMTLEHGTEHTIPLKQELALVRTYVEIEKVRFQNRLNVEYEIDAHLSDMLLPSMILQPLVENSIRFGVARADTETIIRISATKSQESLQLTVRDNGAVSNTPVEDETHGTGLANLQMRLERLYGKKAQLRIARLPESGVEVRILLPLVCENN